MEIQWGVHLVFVVLLFRHKNYIVLTSSLLRYSVQVKARKENTWREQKWVYFYKLGNLQYLIFDLYFTCV